MGFGSLTTSLPYCPTTRIEGPSGVVTALMVSAVAKAPGFRSVATCVGDPLSETLTTATPAPGGGFGLLWGATLTPANPATYAQWPAQAMLALEFGRPPKSSGV